MTFIFEKKHMLEPSISSLSTDSFYNELFISYSLDPSNGSFSNSLVLRDQSSVDFYGVTKPQLVEAPGIYTQEAAQSLAIDRLTLYSGESYSVSFTYQDLLLPSPLVLFDTGICQHRSD